MSSHWGVSMKREMVARLMYVVVGCAVVAGVVLLGEYGPDDPRSIDTISKWVGLGLLTAMVFGYLFYYFRPFFARKVFWAFTVLSLPVHLATGVVLLRRVMVVPKVAFLGVGIVEFIVLYIIFLRLSIIGSNTARAHLKG